MDGEHFKIARQDQQLTVAVGTSLPASGSIYYAKSAGGNLLALAGQNFTTLTWYGSHNGTDYVLVYNAGTAVTTPISAPCGDVIPDACFGYPYLKVTGDQSGQLQICLKG